MIKKTWDKNNSDLLEKIKAETEKVYPNLHFRKNNSLMSIKGSFPVIHDNKILDRFSIEIIIPRDYPESVPIVREVDSRIPRTADRHMNEKGEACLFLPDERWEVWPIGSSFLSFLQVPVHNFFLGQSLVEHGSEWPFGQWEHGAGGIYTYYSHHLGTTDLDKIIYFLNFLLKPKMKSHQECPCGSRKRLRDCHWSKFINLKEKIPTETMKNSIEKLLNAKYLILNYIRTNIK